MGSSVLLRTRGGVQKQRTLHPRGVPRKVCAQPDAGQAQTPELMKIDK